MSISHKSYSSEESQRRRQRRLWGVAICIYLVLATVLVTNDFLRTSRFDLTETLQKAKENEEKKAARKKEEKKKEEIPKKELEKMSKFLAEKKIERIKKDIEKVKEAIEKIEKAKEIAREEYNKELTDEEELYRRIASIANAIANTDELRQLDSHHTQMMQTKSRDLIRSEKDRLLDHAERILSLNSLLTPSIEKIEESNVRDRTQWRSSEISRLVQAAKDGNFAAAREVSHKPPTSEVALPTTDSPADWQHAIDEMKKNLDLAFDEFKTFENGSILEQALDQTMSSALLDAIIQANPQNINQLASDFLPTAFPDVPFSPANREQFEDNTKAWTQASDEAARLAAQANSLANSLAGSAVQSAEQFQMARDIHSATTGQSQQSRDRNRLDLSALMQNLYAAQDYSRGGITADNRNTTFAPGFISSDPSKRPRVTQGFEDARIIAESIPARRVYPNSKRQGWLFIDSYYIIGPWDSGFRQTSHLLKQEPETRINLDAQYPGKIDPATGKPRILKWEYTQTDIVYVRPPDDTAGSYYYAYSEVWFAEASNMLLLVGSDDAAKIWLNDIVVWEDEGLSQWALSEGIVKVRFKCGWNKVLVRIYNGPNGTVFSIVLAPTSPSE